MGKKKLLHKLKNNFSHVFLWPDYGLLTIKHTIVKEFLAETFSENIDETDEGDGTSKWGRFLCIVFFVVVCLWVFFWSNLSDYKLDNKNLTKESYEKYCQLYKSILKIISVSTTQHNKLQVLNFKPKCQLNFFSNSVKYLNMGCILNKYWIRQKT